MVEEISVLIPVLDEYDYLPTLYRSLLAQDFAGEVRYYFIDGGSSDGTFEYLRELSSKDSRIVVLKNPRRTTQYALNIGLAAAVGTYIVRFDAHTHFPAHYLRVAKKRLDQGDVASVSGPAIAVGENDTSRAVAAALATRLGVGGSDYRTAITEETVIDSGFCGMWLKQTLTDVGGWDESTYPNEDAELAARIRARGGTIVCLPELSANYQPRSSFTGLAKQYFRYGTFRVSTSVKHPESVRLQHVVPPALVIASAGTVLGRGRCRALGGGLLASYGVLVLAASLVGAQKSNANIPKTAVATATMHYAWGAGYLNGCRKYSVPFEGLKTLFMNTAKKVF